MIGHSSSILGFVFSTLNGVPNFDIYTVPMLTLQAQTDPTGIGILWLLVAAAVIIVLLVLALLLIAGCSWRSVYV